MLNKTIKVGNVIKHTCAWVAMFGVEFVLQTNHLPENPKAVPDGAIIDVAVKAYRSAEKGMIEIYKIDKESAALLAEAANEHCLTE